MTKRTFLTTILGTAGIVAAGGFLLREMPGALCWRVLFFIALFASFAVFLAA